MMHMSAVYNVMPIHVHVHAYAPVHVHVHVQGHRQDFSRGGSVCETNCTMFKKKPCPIITN